jgi:DNA-binding NarL/FixJ family response regulator
LAGVKSVLIIDDHPLFREGMKSLISQNSRLEVVGEAGTGTEGLRIMKELKPDIVLVDISLPDMSGIEVTREIVARFPEVHVLIVSMHSKINYVSEAFEAGAIGYVLKESAGERLVQGIETVCRGEYFIDSSLSRNIAKRLVNIPREELKGEDQGYAYLTVREQQILRMLAEGLSTKDIAAALYLSPKTVENHRANIMEKLDLHTSVELVRYAAKLGLINIDIWKN